MDSNLFDKKYYILAAILDFTVTIMRYSYFVAIFRFFVPGNIELGNIIAIVHSEVT